MICHLLVCWSPRKSDPNLSKPPRANNVTVKPKRPSPHDRQQELRTHRQVLQDWYGFDFSDAELARLSAFKHLGSIIPELLEKLKLDQRAAEANIIKVWNTILDPTITAHAQPTGYRNGVLYVGVDSSTWLHELTRYRKDEILEGLQNALGKDFVRQVVFHSM